MRWLARLIVLILCQISVMVQAEERVALVVGNSTYANIASLPNPRNDAFDVSMALETLNFDVIVGLDSSAQDMRANLALFAEKARSADVALFYFAGHGFQVANRNYLAPVDANLKLSSDIPTQTVSLDDVLQTLKGSDALKLVFVDACRDNPFGQISDTVETASRGLAEVASAPNLLYAFATRPGKAAYDGTGRNSPFTQALLTHIHRQGIEIKEMLVSVRRDVFANTQGYQLPWTNEALLDSFWFNPGPDAPGPEDQLWQVAALTESEELMKIYLSKFPDGAHASDVAVQLAHLKSGQTGGLWSELGETASSARSAAVEDGEALWRIALQLRTSELFEEYLDIYPDGRRAPDARRMLSDIDLERDVPAAEQCEQLATHERDGTAHIPGVSFSPTSKECESSG